MRRSHRWWKGVGAVPVLLLLSGCATYTRSVDTIAGVAKSGAASVEILKGPAEDVGKVWETAFPPEPAK